MNLFKYSDTYEHVNNDTPVFEFDTLTTSGVTYIRWENNDTDDITIKAVDETGATIKIGYATGVWGDRASLTYKGFHEFGKGA
jgi:hypothetical protein